MITKIRQIRETLRHVRLRSILLAVLVLLILSGIASFTGFHIHAMQKEILLLQGERNSREATMEYDRYLMTRVNIVMLVGYTVEDMLKNSMDPESVERYLTDETDYIIATLDPHTTGLYGWVKGVYLDGSGWVPDADYVATERPWYTQTLESDRKITCIEPYLDAQTGTVMMTVAKLLSDGVSVIAMDISLDPIQEILKRVSASTEGSLAFLLDEKGLVVAHSDVSQLGRNYLAEPDSLGGLVARGLLLDGSTQFEVNAPEGNYIVYIDSLEGGWYSVSLVNADIWHRPIHRTMLAFSAILALLVLGTFAVFLHLTAKNIALQELHMRVDQQEKRGEQLQALSETDRMTGLNDHVSGERKVSELLSSGITGMFLELDIDQFKSVNDRYGHQTGDLVILAIAEALRNTFRTNDVTMRLGGDEFGVFAVGINSQDMGRSIIQRLFMRLDALVIPELRGEKVHVSIGAALCPAGKTASFHELYALADVALYTSKTAEGNSLTFSED